MFAAADPAAPANLVATAGNAKVDLTWVANAAADNVTGYNVYRGTTATTITEKLNTAPKPTPTNGHNYY